MPTDEQIRAMYLMANLAGLTAFELVSTTACLGGSDLPILEITPEMVAYFGAQ